MSFSLQRAWSRGSLLLHLHAGRPWFSSLLWRAGRPAWGLKENFETGGPVFCLAQIFPYALVLMGDDFYGVETPRGGRDAELKPSAFYTGVIGAKETVPDHQNPAKVLIDVFRILAMVNLVEVGGIEYFLDPTQRGDLLGM